MPRWQVWIDRGGTFTDIVARDADGSLRTLKVLSDHSSQHADSSIPGIRRLLDLPPDASIGPDVIECVKMGTTVATNALLERRGERTVLVTTRGFRDVLRIATQARPRLFDRHIVLPEMLYDRVIEASERVGAGGEILVALDEATLLHELRAAHAAGLRSCAIVFLHGYRFTAHERAAAALARAVGFTHVSASHRISPLLKLVPRGDTTVLDAYVSPILNRYVERLAAQLPGVPLLLMQSSGGLAQADRVQGKDAILSGPAGGIVGMVAAARAAGHERLIGFDMGGTSTDVSHFAGTFERAFDTEVGGIRVRAPMMNIHTIAAGGGSIIRFDGTRLRVGPKSAGSDPGPASYRRGGPLTLTDANVLLGRVQPGFFPAVFGPRGNEPLDAAVVQRRFGELKAAVCADTGDAVQEEELAAGALRIAVGDMANAIKRISVARGYDVTGYTLHCFGGAGGQHACLVADALGMEQVFCHPLAGVMCAYGMGVAAQTAMREASLDRALTSEGVAAANGLAARLEAEARAELASQGLAPDALNTRRLALIRYRGTDTGLPCLLPPLSTPLDLACALLRARFESAYRQRFSFLIPQAPLLIEAVSVECGNTPPAVPFRELPSAATAATVAHTMIQLYCFSGGEPAAWRASGLYLRGDLDGGACVDGPAVIVEPNGTVVVEPGWRARVTPDANLELTRTSARSGAAHGRADDRAPGCGAPGCGAPGYGAPVDRPDPVLLEIFNNRFMSIAQQMGQQLQNSAHSVNIKERLDFSCALFDAAGALIANAPHIPVHLGSMSESVRAVIDRNPAMRPGDVFALNDPYHGGTHLPDITVVTPVFLAGASPAFFTASRGHHADIGGMTPGSMPPFSTTLEEEGVLLDNVALVENGVMREEALLGLLGTGRYPARNPAQNIADLRAQIAANDKGARELAAMIETHGHETVIRYMRHVQDNAEECVRRVIAKLRNGSYALPLDNGAQIHVALRVDAAARSACIDFSGTSAQQPNNFNAPRAITVAAVLYVFRTLVDDDIPLNAGCLKPLNIIVPDGSMLNPRPPAAVVAGNVETSMCITNALYGALGIMAASQCTMNNFTFGSDRYQYYETIAGGSGAGPGFAGTSVVQTHMTNSRLTDPEVLENRFPVRVESFAIRAGSGGAGLWRGGDGAVRRIRFLEPMTAAIVSNGRAIGAFGMAGGAPGEVGVNRVERADGPCESLGATDQLSMAIGDLIEISSPGGGGWGVDPNDSMGYRKKRAQAADG